MRLNWQVDTSCSRTAFLSSFGDISIEAILFDEGWNVRCMRPNPIHPDTIDESLQVRVQTRDLDVKAAALIKVLEEMQGIKPDARALADAISNGGSDF